MSTYANCYIRYGHVHHAPSLCEINAPYQGAIILSMQIKTARMSEYKRTIESCQNVFRLTPHFTAASVMPFTAELSSY